MSIQTGSGALRIDADDLQLAHRGKAVALKLRVIQWPQLVGCLNDGSGWRPVTDLTGDAFSSDPPGGGDAVAYAMAQAGGVDAFVRNVVLPRLNEWLATVWEPGETAVTPLESLQSSLLRLRLVVQADGTVRAEA